VSRPRIQRKRRIRFDIAAILLAPLGIGVVVLSQIVDGVALRSLLHGPAAAIVFGGTLGAVLISFTPGEILAACRAAARAYRAAEDDSNALAATIVALSLRAHRRGLMTLDDEVDTIEEPFLRDGLMLAVDGTPVEILRDMLTTERHAREADEDLPARVFEAAAGYAPTMGILGAVLGLVRVMEHLTAPGALGPGIAVAFISTVYGVAAANLLLLPVAGRLRERAAGADRRRELMSEGIYAIHEGLNPRLVAQRLRVFATTMPKIEDIAARNGIRPLAPRIPA
jgi:chemotaxis protein MotA